MLLVVDPQIDFVSGSLPVPGAAEAMIALAHYIRKHENTYAIRIVTADWHPYHHSSFKEEGGTWPRHCVQHSKGAALYTPILKALNEVRGGFTLLYKGDSIDKDEPNESLSLRTFISTLLLTSHESSPDLPLPGTP